MLRLLRLLFMGYWHDKPQKPEHICKRETVEVLLNKYNHRFDTYTSKVYVQRCTGCGKMSHYEVR